MVIRDTGNVGIGTTDPPQKLSVSGVSRFMSNGGAVQIEGTDHTYLEYYPDGTGAGRKAWVGYGSANDNHFTINNDAGSGHVNIGSGNVGIGSSAPSQKLDVNGVIKNKNPTWSVYKGSTGGSNSGILQYNTAKCTAVNVTMNIATVGNQSYYYRATITVAGRYFVGFQGFADPGQNGGGHEIYIRKNGSTQMVRNYMNAPTNNYNTHGGLGVILDLSVNDYLEIYSGKTMHHNANCSFYGFMIG
jgi:hypothetical protein